MSYLYIFSNPAMPGFVKIGRTGDVEQRRRELSISTNVPKSFKIEAVYNGANWEPLIRRHLHDYRTSKDEFAQRKTEFFELDPHDAKELVARYLYSKDFKSALSNLVEPTSSNIKKILDYKNDFKDRLQNMIEKFIPSTHTLGEISHNEQTIMSIISKIRSILGKTSIHCEYEKYYTHTGDFDYSINLNMSLFSQHHLIFGGLTIPLGISWHDGSVNSYMPLEREYMGDQFTDYKLIDYSDVFEPICSVIQKAEDVIISTLSN
jgi:hypothetical protein